MTNYIGTCRGGPMNGKHLSVNQPTYRLQEFNPPSPLVDSEKEQPAPPARVLGTYRHQGEDWLWEAA